MQMVCGVISLSAPSSLRRFSEEALAQLGRGEVFELASSRTGQTLHVDPIWLYEQDNDSDAHDLPARVGEIIVPVVVIHGAEDPTVPPSDAVSLASANPSRVWVHIVEHGDHVFNTPNPFAPTADPSPELADAWGEIDRTLGVWFS
jgi:pimeloyl-ACP methyl ester carboxylesterase